MFNQLIGAELIKINRNHIVVEKDGEQYEIIIDDDGGDCCGYNEIETHLLVSENSRPVITSVKVEDTGDSGWSDETRVTFFGESKPIAEINSLSSSGSGWQYGATVTLICNKLHINQILSSW